MTSEQILPAHPQSIDALRRIARRHPEKIAIHLADSGRSISYAELNIAADRSASRLRLAGVGEGDVVALLLENSAETLELWWAARRAGAYYAPLSTRLEVDELEHIIRDSSARAIIVSPAHESLAAALDRHLGDGQCPPIYLLHKADEFPDFHSLGQPNTPLTEARSTLCGRELIYSSGTTGRPRGIRRPLTPAGQTTLPDLELHMRRLFELDEETVYLSVSPLYHATGRFLNRVIEEGGIVVILPKFDPLAALAAIEHYRVTHTQWVPTMFVRLLALPLEERTRFDLSSQRVALHAAAPCPMPVKRAMLDWWGPIIHEYYGGSENAGVTFIRAEDWLRRPGSVGRSINGSIHIVDEDSGRELPVGEIGLILFEGGVSFTYLHEGEGKPDAGQTTLAGYGDLGHVDEDGYLFISDRRSDLIISGGVNIYPKEVELILEEHPAVREVAVIGIPDPEFGQQVKAVICVADGLAANDHLADELIRFCRSRLSRIKCPRSVSIIDNLPRNDNGKLLKRVLRETFASDDHPVTCRNS